ncbi:MAG: ABC transporter permease [Planctomycetes bacterium]|nr:ABC transporter permease [Planctomycetota bacterium]
MTPDYLPSWWPQLLTVLFAAGVAHAAWNNAGPRALLEEAGSRLMLLWAVFACLHHLPKRRAWLLSQVRSAAISNLYVVSLVGVFIGMIFALQAGIELARFGQQDQIGPLVAAGIAREMGPFITALVLASTYGSAMAAEMGTMAVSDELTALEVMSIDRVSLLVLPRVVALAIVCPAMTVISDMIGIIGGGFVASAQLGVGWDLYLDSAITSLSGLGETFPVPKDVFGGLFKSFCFGIAVALISCASGISARGGALGVGRATSRAVRDATITIIVANYFLTWMIYR